LLIDWRYGKAYFAEKLLDFELPSNNGNWQLAAVVVLMLLLISKFLIRMNLQKSLMLTYCTSISG